MTPEEFAEAWAAIAVAHDLKKAPTAAALGRACGLGGVDPGQSIRDYRDGATPVPGPVAVLMRLYAAGIAPPDEVGGVEVFRTVRARRPVDPL